MEDEEEMLTAPKAGTKRRRRDEEVRARELRERVIKEEHANHKVQRTKTRGATVSSRDLEDVAPPMPEDEDDGLWRPEDDMDFLIRVSGSKTLNDTLRATLANMADHCKVLCIYKTLPRWRAWVALFERLLRRQRASVEPLHCNRASCVFAR